MSQGNAAKSVMGIFATWVFLYPFSIIISILVARILGPFGKGLFTFAKIWGGFLIPFASFGFHTGVLYYLSNEKYRIEDVFFTIYLSAIVIGVLLGLGILLALEHNLLGNISKNLTFFDKILISLLVVVNTLLMFTNRMLRGIGLFGLMNMMNIYKSVFLMIALVVIVLIMGGSYHDAIFAMFISQFLALLTIGLSLRIKRNSKIKFKLNLGFIKDSFQYGIKAYWANLANITKQRADQFIMSLFVPASDLGFYSIAANVSELPWVLVRSLNPVLFKNIALYGEKERVKLTNRILRITFFILGIVYIILFFTSHYLIKILYGPSFGFSAILMKFYIPGAMFYALVSVVAKYFLAVGRPEKTSFIQIISAIVGLVAYLVLIGSFGVIGAAIASSITYTFTALLAIEMYSMSIENYVKLKIFLLNKEDIVWLKKQVENILAK